MVDAAFLYAALAGLFGVIAFAARWALARRALAVDAREEYADRQARKPATIDGLDQATFVRIYVDSFTPRWSAYAALGLLAVVLISPAALVVVPMLYEFIWRLNGAPDWAGRGGYVFMFSLFFGICLIWAATAGVFARLHHMRAPEPFQFALARARGEPIPEDGSWRRRPKWARRARPLTEEERAEAEAGDDGPQR